MINHLSEAPFFFMTIIRDFLACSFYTLWYEAYFNKPIGLPALLCVFHFEI